MPGWADLFRRRDKSQHPTHRKSHRSKTRAKTVAPGAHSLPIRNSDRPDEKGKGGDDAQLVASTLGVSRSPMSRFECGKWLTFPTLGKPSWQIRP